MLSLDLDELDHQIVAELRKDGRQPNTEMARRFGVAESTVRNRIQRLVSQGIIQVSARVNLSRLGYDQSVIIGVQCHAGQTVKVARALSAMVEIRHLSYVAGRYDLVLFAFFPSREDLFKFVVEQIGQIPGIDRTETLYELGVAKRDYGFWEYPDGGLSADQASWPVGSGGVQVSR